MTTVAVLRCVGVIATTGQRCGMPTKPGTRRCGLHTTVPPERARCQHTWGNGTRCEGKVPDARIGKDQVCATHRRPCANTDCLRQVGLLDGLCRSCASRLARDAAAAANAGKPKMTPQQKYAANFGHLPRCVEWSSETDQPCALNALPGNGRCVKHQNIPADEDRCGHEWDATHRCTRLWVTKGDRRCQFHSTKPGRTGRPLKGDEPVFRPCPGCGKLSKGALGCAAHAPQCSGVTAAGNRCGRYATSLVGGAPFCRTHAARPVTPAPAPLKGPAALCGLPSGATGTPCGMPVEGAGTRCHRHAALPTVEDRCLHVYDSGEQCPSRSRKAHGHGHGTMCARHTVPCAHPGCDQAVSDTVRQLCPQHAPRCVGTVTNGQQCAHPAVPGDSLCSIHRVEPATGPRCAWIHGNGERCRTALPAVNGTSQVRRDLCPTHQVPCGHPDCDRTTAFADGLCVRHRPRCGHGACQSPALAGALCWRHHAVEENGTCSLLTKEGEPCQNPAVVDTVLDGRICTHHNTTISPDEDRCGHRHETGERCALATQDGTLFCVVHQAAHSTTCGWTTPSGAVCGKPTVPRPGEDQPTCEVHRRGPADEDRCEHLMGGARCPAVKAAGFETCIAHAARTVCGVTVPTGEPCGRPILVRVGEAAICQQHTDLPVDSRRCNAVVGEGDRCPAVREDRRDFCARHADQQPQCVAVDDRDVRCRSYAPTGFDLCDRHALWEPGQPYDRPDEYEAFFLAPRLDLVWELAAAEAENARGTDATIAPVNTGSGETGVRELDDLTAHDPYDLTGARRTYVELVADGTPAEEALLAARLIANHLAPNTVSGLTKQLRPYLEWCQENSCVPVPASRTTIMRFLAYLTERGRVWDGKPLSSGTMASFRQAIVHAHSAVNLPDPFEQHSDLAALLKGYNRMYSKPQVQAHAIRIDELAALIAAATSGAQASLRDQVIVTVVADPEAGISLGDGAARWQWKDIQFVPGQDTLVTIWKGRTSSPTRNDLVVPNRSAAASASGHDFSTGMPLEARVCGTAALQALAAERISEGLPLSGPVLLNSGGSAISKQGVVKVLSAAARKAGLKYAPTFAFDDRVRLLEAIGEPVPRGLRDAAVMALSWWASLRRSEVSALNVGDIGKDARGRGLVVLVRKSKTDVHGQFVPVPYVRDSRGNLLPTDASRALHHWMAAYAQHLGRELTDEDPLFINLQASTGGRLGEKGVADIVTRYAQDAGIHAELGERISSHGFRAGYATEWLASGRPSEPLAKRQRRSSTQSLLGYFRLADPFEDSLAFTFDAPEDAFLAFEMKQLEAQARREDRS